MGFVSSIITATHAQPIVSLRVEQVAWGTSTTNPTIVEPGDTNAPLTVDVRNLSNETLKGVYGTLLLSEPFTDYLSGDFNATAPGVPLQAGDIFNQTGEILPAGSFSFTFRLDIARDATPGSHDFPVLTEYLVKSDNSTWLLGTPQTLDITILLPNRSPTIDALTPAATALAVEVGNSLNFTVKCSDPDGDTVTYEWELDAILVSNATEYTYTPVDEDVGSHTLTLTVSDGRLTSSQTWTITVTTASVTQFSVSGNYVTAGFDNSLNITIRNNLWQGRVQASLTAPQPLIIRGNQSWTFDSMQPSENLSIAPSVFAPVTAIGSTFSAALTVNYGDEHGLTYTDTYSAGLIVQGYVKLIVYDVLANPEAVASGSEVTLTATALNTGNVIASFANASLEPNDVLQLSRESSTYVGEIELNSPVPFTVVATVKSGAQNGTYPVTIRLAYQDDQYRQHVLNVSATILVATGTSVPQDSNGTGSLQWFMNNGGWTIIVIVATGIVLLVLYVRRLSKAKVAPKPS
jgi:PKD repeat protein